MKYLVNRETKEHMIAPSVTTGGFSKHWHVVQADPEGWISHNGGECPLPDDARCELWWEGARPFVTNHPQGYLWSECFLYRPILEDKAAPAKSITAMIKNSGAEPTPCMDVLTRLSIAHKAASEIPDLVKQLRAQLEPLGLGVMYLSQFDGVEP